MPHEPIVPLYKLTAEELGSFENAQGVIKDNLFWVKSCRFEGMEDGNVPWQGQDSGFIWLEENDIIMCDSKYTVVDFETK